MDVIGHLTVWKYGACNGQVQKHTYTVWGPSDVKSPTRRSTPQSDGWREPLAYTREVSNGDSRCVLMNVSAAGKYLTGYCPPARELRYTGFNIPCASNTSSKLYSVPSFPSGFKANLENKALAKLKSRGVNLSVAFAERAETVSMVSKTVDTLIKGYRAARRGDVPAIARILGCRELQSKPSKMAANLWLQYQYGWKPLYNDVYDGVSMLLDNDLNRPKRYTATVTASATSNDRYVETSSSTLSGCLVECRGIRYARDTVFKGFIRLDYYLTNPQLATASQLGVVNPLEVIWETVPFSFVVDWFIPVGAALSALDATAGWSFRGGSYSTKRLMKTRIEKPGSLYWGSSTIPFKTGFVYVTGLSGGSTTYRRMSFARTVYATSPSANLPRLAESPFSTSRLLSAISLFRQVVLGKA